MNQTTTTSTASTRPALPLALIFTSRLLLTEKSSVTEDGHSLFLSMERLTLRTTMGTPTLEEISDYNHYGIND